MTYYEYIKGHRLQPSRVADMVAESKRSHSAAMFHEEVLPAKDCTYDAQEVWRWINKK